MDAKLQSLEPPAQNSYPLPEGFVSVQTDTSPVQQRALRVSRAKSLKELEKDYAFFTPGLIYLHVPLNGVDPLANFIQEAGGEVATFTLQFDRPVFRGLGDAGNRRWNHVLMAIERPFWNSFLLWARTLTFLDQSRGVLVRVRPMLITVADPLHLQKSAVISDRPPMVDIGVLALDTSRGGIYLEDSGNPLTGPPHVVRTGSVFRDTEVFAKAVLAEDPNPWRKVEEDQIDPDLGLTPSEAWLLKRFGNRDPVKVMETVDISQLPADEQQQIHKLAEEYLRLYPR